MKYENPNYTNTGFKRKKNNGDIQPTTRSDVQEHDLLKENEYTAK